MKTALERGEPTDRDQDTDCQRENHLGSQPDDANRAPARDGHARREPERRPPQTSSSTNFLLIVVVALVSGTIGAMANSYFFGSHAGASPGSQSKPAGGSDNESGQASGAGAGSTALAAGGATTQASTSSPIPGVGSAQEVEELKQQIKNLNQRIAGLNERVDRLQDLLSLAVPLLQRIAPKN